MAKKKVDSSSEPVPFEGEFEVLSDSRLAFLPQNQERKIILSGTWFLDDKHDLRFRVSEDSTKRFGKELVFKGEFLKAEAGELDFTYRTRTKEGKIAIRTFRFFGKWEADPNNRLTFVLNRSRGKTLALTLNGAWKINKRYQIVYTYRKEELKTKRKIQKRLVFRGYWEIAEKRRVSYVLEGDSQAKFRFRLAYSTPIILAKKNEIRFQIGIEVTGRRRSATRDITLFGKWKLKRNLSLTFEVEYKKGLWHAIQFDAKYRLNSRSQIEAELFAKNGEDIGFALTISGQFLEAEGDAFLRLERSFQESRIEAGVQIPF